MYDTDRTIKTTDANGKEIIIQIPEASQPQANVETFAKKMPKQILPRQILPTENTESKEDKK